MLGLWKILSVSMIDVVKDDSLCVYVLLCALGNVTLAIYCLKSAQCSNVSN
jgi:hypothetical protein